MNLSEINDIIKAKLQYLTDFGVNVSLFEIKLLMADVLNIDVGSLRFCNITLNEEQLSKFEKYIEMKSKD